MIRNAKFAVLATVLAGAAAIAPTVASASNVAWSVSVGGPGFAVSAGAPAYGPGYGPGYGYRPYYRPAPVVYRSYVPAYVPPPVYVQRPRPVVYAPRPVYYAPPPVVIAPPPYYAPYGGYRY